MTHVEILKDVVKVYSDSNFLFHFRVSSWSKTQDDEDVCSCCNMSNFCENDMFRTPYGFRELVCQKIGLRLRPKITEENAKILCLSVRGKIVKKNLRKALRK